MDEIWKPVVGFEGQYEVSNLCRVRSLDRVIYYTRGGIKIACPIKGRILKVRSKDRGYPQVWLPDDKMHNVRWLMREVFE